MLNKIDNSFSFSIDEILSNINTDIDLKREAEKIKSNIITYLGNEKLYNDWLAYIGHQLHLSMPNEEKDFCKFCKGNSKLEDDKACKNYMLIAELNLINYFAMYVCTVESNKNILKPKELLQELTHEYFSSLLFEDGELKLNAKRFDNLLITHQLFEIRNNFKSMDSTKAFHEINEAIEELETQKIISKTCNRELYDTFKPQLKLLKKLKKTYSNKIDIKKKLSIDEIDESTDKKDFKFKNKFDTNEPSFVYNYFKENLVDKKFLTIEQLEKYLVIAFKNKEPQTPNEKLKFSNKHIGNITKVYYEYWSCAKITHGTQTKYAKLLGEFFEGFTTKKVIDNFAKNK